MKAGVDRSGAAKGEGEDKNASEKASPGVEKIKIKIADPPTLSRIPAPHSSATTKTLVLRTQPASISYPSHLFSLAGECFSTTEKGYKYTVCPFFNVTQKEMGAGWNKFEGVLGVWREWIIENDTISGMQFVMGEKCGGTDREAMVYFNCSTTTSVHTIKEHHTCKYSIWLDTPLACFKGAMQVYQLLNEEQLKRWDNLDEGYYAGELTEQGLKAKRREILVEANLLYSQEHSEHAAFPSKEPPKVLPFTAPTRVAPVSMEKDSRSLINSHIPLTHCIEQNVAVRKELKEVKAQLDELLTMIAEFPSVAARYAALKNGSAVPKINHSADTFHSVSSHNESREIKNLHQKEAGQWDIRLEDRKSQQRYGLETHDIHQEADRELGPRGDDKPSNTGGDDGIAPILKGNQEGPSQSVDHEQKMQGNTPSNANDPMGQGKDEPQREEERAKRHTSSLREEEKAEDHVPVAGKDVRTARTGNQEEQEEGKLKEYPQSDATNMEVDGDARKEYSVGVVHVHGGSQKPGGKHSVSKEEKHGQQGGGSRVKGDTEQEGDEQVDKILHGEYSKTTPDRNNGRESL